MNDYNNYIGSEANYDSDLQFPKSTEMEGQHGKYSPSVIAQLQV